MAKANPTKPRLSPQWKPKVLSCNFRSKIDPAQQLNVRWVIALKYALKVENSSKCCQKSHIYDIYDIINRPEVQHTSEAFLASYFQRHNHITTGQSIQMYIQSRRFFVQAKPRANRIGVRYPSFPARTPPSRLASRTSLPTRHSSIRVHLNEGEKGTAARLLGVSVGALFFISF
jgi:hypothetical protein